MEGAASEVGEWVGIRRGKNSSKRGNANECRVELGGVGCGSIWVWE